VGLFLTAPYSLKLHILFCLFTVRHHVLSESYRTSMEQATANSPRMGSFTGGRELDLSDRGAIGAQEQIVRINGRHGNAGERVSRAATPLLTTGEVTPLMTRGRVTPTSTPIYGKDRSQLKEPEGLILVKNDQLKLLVKTTLLQAINGATARAAVF